MTIRQPTQYRENLPEGYLAAEDALFEGAARMANGGRDCKAKVTTLAEGIFLISPVLSAEEKPNERRGQR